MCDMLSRPMSNLPIDFVSTRDGIQSYWKWYLNSDGFPFRVLVSCHYI